MKQLLSISSTMFIALAVLLIHDAAYSLGTPAGTTIQTRSRVVYSTASGVSQDTIYSNSVSFTVAQVATVNLTPSTNASTTSSDSVYVTYPLTITNSGNGTDKFNLSSTSSLGWSREFYFDANGDGILQSGEISAGAITQTANIAADAAYKTMVRLFVPRDASLNGQTDVTVVTVKSDFDSLKLNTSQLSTTVSTVYFSNIGSSLTVSPSNPSPGDNVVYTLSLTNNGDESATGVTFTDVINTSLFSYVSATPSGIFSIVGNTGTWNFGTINAGATASITITLNVNAGLPNGTVLNNVVTVAYTVGGNTFTLTSNDPSAAVGTTHGVQIAPTVLSASREVEDTLAYAMTVKNTGNVKDILELSYSSSKSYTWTFFRDVNGNATLDGSDTQLTDAAGSPAGVDVDSVATSDSVKILARLIVPKVTTDQEQETATFTVKSGADASKFQTASATTTIGIPDLVLTRTVSPSGDQPPGQEMTFQVAYQNNGHGKAYNVTFTETEADSMSYVANSVTIDNVAKTDAADADEVSVTTVGGRKVITISVGTLNALSSQAIVRYRATIH